jgi:hypothetical protein
MESLSGTRMKPLRESRVPVDASLAAALGVDGRRVFADYEALHRKHPEHFPAGPEQVKGHVEAVMHGPSDIFPGAEPDHRLIVRRMGQDRAVAVEVELRGGKHRVRSAYIFDPGQYETKREKALGAPSAVPEPVPGSKRKRQIVQGGGAPSGRASEGGQRPRPKSTAGRKPRKPNPAAFGTRERRKAYGAQEGGSRSGARASRKKHLKAGREASTRALDLAARLGQAEADGKRLTKTQLAALRKAEARLQKEGALPNDAELRRLAKDQKAQDRALDKILGAGRRAFAVKVAREDRPFDREDLEAFQGSGWEVRPAGTVAAKVGRLMAALNPEDALRRVLGPKGEARAVILAAPQAFGEDTVFQLRAHGLDVSAAPRRDREGLVKANPVPGQKGPKGATRRERTAEHGAMSNTSPRAKGKPARKATSAAARRRPAASKAPRPARRPALHRLNPGSLEDVWRTWTGSAPSKTLRLEVQPQAFTAKGRILLPKETVMLGRVSKFYLETGVVEDFGNAGPLMVTDADMKRIWLVDTKPRTFDHKVALIGYLARKPKFGDTGTVEYIHEFSPNAEAVMAGQVGAIKGRFRLTERGIEG